MDALVKEFKFLCCVVVVAALLLTHTVAFAIGWDFGFEGGRPSHQVATAKTGETQ